MFFNSITNLSSKFSDVTIIHYFQVHRGYENFYCHNQVNLSAWSIESKIFYIFVYWKTMVWSLITRSLTVVVWLWSFYIYFLSWLVTKSWHTWQSVRFDSVWLGGGCFLLGRTLQMVTTIVIKENRHWNYWNWNSYKIITSIILVRQVDYGCFLFKWN